MARQAKNFQEDLAPVILFIYNRPYHTRRTLEALSQNVHADESILFVFADGPKENANATELSKINEARKIVGEKKWCKQVELITREKNMNLEDNVIEGVTKIINEYGKAIILEDDLVTSPYFLQYCNEGLIVYQYAKQIFSINASTFNIDFETDPETYLAPIATHSSGWATWADRWNLLEENPQNVDEIESDVFLKNRFNVGAQDKVMLLKHVKSWDIRWYYTAFLRNGLGVFPTKSLILNIGFDGSGTHKIGEDLVEELYLKPISVVYQETINLKHYSKMLNFVKPYKYSRTQKIKEAIKKILGIKRRNQPRDSKRRTI